MRPGKGGGAPREAEGEGVGGGRAAPPLVSASEGRNKKSGRMRSVRS